MTTFPENEMTLPCEAITRDAALAYLLQRIDYERAPRFPYRSRTLWLERMRQVLDGLDNPQNGYPILHVAGTKGKGSASAMMAAILSAAGYRTGLYTSPHLEQIEERMMVDGRPCRGSEFAALIRDVGRIVERLDALPSDDGRPRRPTTYFEITTAAALLHFARRAVDVAVLEVGLGGRLDATNVCQPVVTAITSISFDHCQQLGNTLAAIAGEKAGIIKPGVPIVSGVTAEEAAAVIRERAAERGSVCYEIGRDFRVDYHGIELAVDHRCGPISAGRAAGADQPATELLAALEPSAARLLTRLDYRETAAGGTSYQDLASRLLGCHQARNAGVAVMAIHRLRQQGWTIPESAIREGLANLYVPARTEVLQRTPPVVVDAAHNVASVQALLTVLDEAFPDAPGRVLVFATSRDKDVPGMLECLLKRFDQVILTRYRNNPRYVHPEELHRIAVQLLEAGGANRCQLSIEPDPAAAWSAAIRIAGERLICVTGSFFLAAEIRTLLCSEAIAVADAS